MEIGLQDDPHFLDEDAGVRGAAFAHARSLGVSSLRANVAWASVVSDPAAKTAPAVVNFDFSRFDRLIDEAASKGIRVQLTLTGDAPAWATRDRKISDDLLIRAIRGVRRGRRFALLRARPCGVDLERAELARAAQARAAVRQGDQEGQGRGQEVAAGCACA